MRSASVVLKATTFPSIERVSYSTCSIYEQENEQVVARILEARPDFEVVKVRQSAATPIFFNYYLMKLYPNQHLFVPGRPGLHRPRLSLCELRKTGAPFGA